MHLPAWKPDLIILNSVAQSLINGERGGHGLGERCWSSGGEKKTFKCDSEGRVGGNCIVLCLCLSLSRSLSNIWETWICPSSFLMTQAPSGHSNTPQPSHAGCKRAVITLDQDFLLWNGRKFDMASMSRDWWKRGIQGLLKRGPDLSIAARLISLKLNCSGCHGHRSLVIPSSHCSI